MRQDTLQSKLFKDVCARELDENAVRRLMKFPREFFAEYQINETLIAIYTNLGNAHAIAAYLRPSTEENRALDYYSRDFDHYTMLGTAIIFNTIITAARTQLINNGDLSEANELSKATVNYAGTEIFLGNKLPQLSPEQREKLMSMGLGDAERIDAENELRQTTRYEMLRDGYWDNHLDLANKIGHAYYRLLEAAQEAQVAKVDIEQKLNAAPPQQLTVYDPLERDRALAAQKRKCSCRFCPC